jgi:hypothetical protein
MKKIHIYCACLFLMAFFSTTVLAGDYLLPDTGQTQSYTNTFGEDSDYLINSPSYTKLDALGNPLPDSAASWIMVRDENTGLIWEVKTTDGSVHDESNTYTWNDAQSVFIADLNANNFGGYNDWRLPNPKELLSIADYSVFAPSINTQYFPNTHDSPAVGDWSHHWTSKSASFNNGRAWHVTFEEGFSHDNDKTKTFWVRAVRGNELTSVFMDNGDGTITDSAAGLMWEQKTDDGGANDKDNIYTWEEALDWVASLNQSNYLGYDDWRLPNVKELQSIVDYSTTPAIDLGFFPNTQSDAYWASSTLESNPTYAWVVGFDFGYVDYSWYTTGKLDTAYVRAVRTLSSTAVAGDGGGGGGGG